MTDAIYEEARIYPTDKRARKELEELLEKEGIRLDGNLEYTLGLYDQKGKLVATGSYFKNTLRCLAVDSAHQGEGLLNRVVSRLMELKADQGELHLFLYTKCDKAPFFADLGFGEIARVDGLTVFMESRREGFGRYLARVRGEECRGLKGGKTAAAIVMNANPFTHGHKYLVEQAASRCGVLHLFMVSEDASVFPFPVRERLIREGTAHIPNIIYHKTDSYMISSATFPSYFLKEADDVILAQAKLDVQVFTAIAKELGIMARYAGDEPYSRVTAAYNRVMKEELPKAGIQFVEIERRKMRGKGVSASWVRQLIHDGKMDEVPQLVPKTTWDFLRSPEGQRIVVAIREAENVTHY